ncbi:MAG: hypothetical protein ACKVHE_22480 [Planctomycetales bacterium]
MTVDHFAVEGLVIVAGRRLGCQQVAADQTRVGLDCRHPRTLRVDIGAELTSKNLDYDQTEVVAWRQDYNNHRSYGPPQHL